MYRQDFRIRAVLAATAAAAAMAWAGGVMAAPLDKPACEAAEAELARYVAAGIEQDVARGPDWAAANVPPDRMQIIGRYFEVIEQLKFRCRFKEKAAAKGKPVAAKQVGPKPLQVKPARPKQKTVRANDAYVPPPGLESTFDLPRPAVMP